MATLTIRNLDDETVDRLKRKAKANGRSLEAELREMLRRESRRMSKAEALAIADEIAERTKHRPQTDSVKLLREDRDR